MPHRIPCRCLRCDKPQDSWGHCETCLKSTAPSPCAICGTWYIFGEGDKLLCPTCIRCLRTRLKKYNLFFLSNIRMAQAHTMPMSQKMICPNGYTPLGPDPFCYQTCFGQGFMPTRDIAILPQELPYQNYAFHQTTHIPQMGCGGNDGIAQQVDIETTLREQTTRPTGGCNVYEFPHWMGFRPLQCEWQMPDFRPLYMTHFPRQLIKDVGRFPDRNHGGGCCYGAPNAYNANTPAGPFGNHMAYMPASGENLGAVTKTSFP